MKDEASQVGTVTERWAVGYNFKNLGEPADMSFYLLERENETSAKPEKIKTTK